MNPTYGQLQRIPPSSTSLSKLNAFRYASNNENGAEASPAKPYLPGGRANKENQTSWLNGVVEQDEPKSDPQQPLRETAEENIAKEPPQTPANRLPLADLIGNAEDAFSRVPIGNDFTPEDYVIWQHVPPSSNASIQTPATQSKKRRHSSSQSSSPLTESSKGAQNGSFDLQSFQTVLKTPQNDLATDLWNNYVAKNTNVSDLQQPRFANLLSSSPRTPASAKTGQDSSGLRRSNSCIAEWPSSKAKRRKVDGERHPTGRAIFSRTRSNTMIPKDFKASNFSSLVKEMERSLRRAPPQQADHHQISPIPAHTKARRSRSATPLEAKPTKPTDEGTAIYGQRGPPSKNMLQGTSSDFGDDDLDDDFLELAEAAMDPFAEPIRMGNAAGGTTTEPKQALLLDSGEASFNNMAHDLPSNMTQPLPTKADHTLHIDEFDDDFEGFSDDIDEILAECDETPSNKLSKAPQQQPPISEFPPHQNMREMPPVATSVSHNENRHQYITSSDEFGDDDFDPDCLDQAIAQAEAVKLSNGT
ncbi:bifunctional ATP-dependent DNA helicase/ssDNA endodeoxyribonuclease DNA2 [Aspergillus lucknowensis]|uniref:Uncharacterized protein n=1 Tax=Aspergillus lucknowensis TaxID=176173 RepID=A0ABR4LLQ7_9EURO